MVRCLFLLLGLYAAVMGRVSAQIGGIGTFHFLDLPGGARSAALGSHVIAPGDGDVSIALTSPAQYDSSSHNQLSWSHSFLLAGIQYGSASYGHHLPKWGITTGWGVQYINYGDFVRADEFSNRLGSFNGRETALRISASKTIEDRLRVGAQLIAVSSMLDTYGVFGMGLTLNAHYLLPESHSAVNVILRNVGRTVSHFSVPETWRTSLIVGYSKSLAHVPFRYFINVENLERWDLRTSRIDGMTPTIQRDGISGVGRFTDNLFRHIGLGGELSLGAARSVQLRFSYDHRRGRELGLDEYRSLSGFNLGFGINTKLLRIDYAYNRYHLAGGNNQLSLLLKLDNLFSKF